MSKIPRDIHDQHNFDFMASSFARMSVQGRDININDITAGMDDVQRAYFIERFHYWKGRLKSPH
ncbi:hypothetical protein [Salmonella enterica]|uniref:hypothetical protein n=1 Tax=Salmonella enterica TaxID=28901 RepID=UPI0023518AD4|nr:hypothetical protein [Salmonella enterica]